MSNSKKGNSAPDDASSGTPANDAVNHPKHYNSHPSNVECIDLVEHLNFCRGNAVKYLFRHLEKHDNVLEDLNKSAWYVKREIDRRSREVEDISVGSSLRGIEFGPHKTLRDKTSKKTTASEEFGIHDAGILDSTRICSSISSSNGSRGVDGCTEQSEIKSNLRDPKAKPREEGSSWDGLQRISESGSSIDLGTSGVTPQWSGDRDDSFAVDITACYEQSKLEARTQKVVVHESYTIGSAMVLLVLGTQIRDLRTALAHITDEIERLKSLDS